jgi:hypothetical protein
MATSARHLWEWGMDITGCLEGPAAVLLTEELSFYFMYTNPWRSQHELTGADNNLRDNISPGTLLLGVVRVLKLQVLQFAF